MDLPKDLPAVFRRRRKPAMSFGEQNLFRDLVTSSERLGPSNAIREEARKDTITAFLLAIILVPIFFYFWGNGAGLSTLVGGLLISLMLLLTAAYLWFFVYRGISARRAIRRLADRLNQLVSNEGP